MFKNESKTKLFVQVSQRHIISGFKSKEVCLSSSILFTIERTLEYKIFILLFAEVREETTKFILLFAEGREETTKLNYHYDNLEINK